MLKFFGRLLVAAMLAVSVPLAAMAAEVQNFRFSSSPSKIRFVVDVDGKIEYKEVKNTKKQLVLEFNAELDDDIVSKVKDPIIKKARLEEKGDKTRLIVDLKDEAQHKVFVLKQPDRLVLDIFRIRVESTKNDMGKGLTHIYRRDDMNGLPVEVNILEIAPKNRYTLKPFSGAVDKNGRGTLLKASKAVGARAAVNASYFDGDGWIIGNLKLDGEWLGMESQPRSAFVVAGGEPVIMQDLAYQGRAFFPKLGTFLNIKGINRSRIAGDVVLYTHYYGPATKTNQWGYEIRIANNGKVTEVSKNGNMKLDKDSVVLSAHGDAAKVLERVQVGDRVRLRETLGSDAADAAELVIGAGPSLVTDGKADVRSAEENIAGDIARGRAPRTAIGVKKDGTVILLVVDGRSSSSAGMSLQELADYMVKLGAWQALNFDGGGSSEMVLDGKILNNPSDGRERAVSVGLGVFPTKG
ncbi:MAG: exopolysaccharide biosynthesis protein [Phascolarctobacterium sp.]|nr:MAG: exopolysaccharide biosynthesis protein [Phascolarctobacterium sp.]